jgi:hypothetical protein
MMGDRDNQQKKGSIDEIIQHMTADIQSSDGQYIPLGFTPPRTPAAAQHCWPEYAASTHENSDNHLYTPHTAMAVNPGEKSMFVSGVCYEINTSQLSKQVSETSKDHSFYYGTAAQQQQQQQQQMNAMAENHKVIGTVVDGGGNIVNVVYSGSNMISPQAYHMMPYNRLPMGGFISYQSGNLDNSCNHLRDYGLFSSGDIQQQSQQFDRQQAQQFRGTLNNRAQLIENLVGNWVPNQSGTYSPFGCVDNGVRSAPPSTNQLEIQTVPVSSNAEMECKGIGHIVRKARIVAEVRPMRPTYSDVLAKSAPITLPSVKPSCNNSNAVNNKSESTNIAKSKGLTSKGNNGKRNNKSGMLKRQHSSSSEEHNGNGNVNASRLIQNPVMTHKSEDGDMKHGSSLPRKWVSLDDLESDKQMTEKLDEEIFQSEDIVSLKILQSDLQNAVGEGGNKKSIGVPNAKSKYGQKGKCCHILIIIVVMFVAMLAIQQIRHLTYDNTGKTNFRLISLADVALILHRPDVVANDSWPAFFSIVLLYFIEESDI